MYREAIRRKNAVASLCFSKRVISRKYSDFPKIPTKSPKIPGKFIMRFFVPDSNIDRENAKAFITGSDVSHLRTVLRAEIGDSLTLCDTAGTVYSCTITEISKDRITCGIGGSEDCPSEPRVPVILLQGVPKGEKMEFIIQKCVELGINGIIPVVTERTVVKFETKQDAAKKVARWQKIAAEASKQSGRGIVPFIGDVVKFRDAFRDIGGGLKIIPYENEHETTLKSLLKEGLPADKIYVFIGPEGGFSMQEIETAEEEGFAPVTLGNRILRTETAGMAALAAIRYEIGD